MSTSPESPSLMSVDGLLDAVTTTLGKSEAISPYTLILGAGFSFPVVPCARDIISRVPIWLEREPSDFWQEVNSRLPGDAQLKLSPKLTPDLSTGDLIGHAYETAMLHGLKSPALRRDFYRSLCNEKKGHINLAHLYLANILYAQDARQHSGWNYNCRFC